MFIKNLQKFFLFITISATALLVYLWYEDYTFLKKPLEEKYIQQLQQKHNELRYLTKLHFNITRTFPIIISDEMSDKRFGMAVYEKGTIKIYLNKKRFQESSNYMINDVFPHEYAHAIMFHIGDFAKQNSGHTKKWQNICKKLNGLRCERFVNHNDILIEKTKLFD
ncbi:SprT-like domain-containing protein [Arcobacter sp. YIC-464]|uniref:SprT-like domain-containing protein n=1 Tax=Arcobacter sp. YIC-464 TaxID=3376631 RepID=UPI003C17293D